MSEGRASSGSPAAGALDVFGAEEAAASLTERLRAVAPAAPRVTPDGRVLLAPAFAPGHDRVQGLTWPRTLVVFGSFASPSTRPLGELIAGVRRRASPGIRLVWRHDPAPEDERAVIFALAAEAAAAFARFWSLTWQLLPLRHHDPRDLHAAIVRADLDPETLIPAMAAGMGSDRIVEDVTSARASGVMYAPTLFVDGVRYDGDLTEGALLAALATP